VKILVAVKQVARLEDDFELNGSAAIDPAALDWQLNEWDTFSLEAALQLLENGAGGEVVAVTVGDERSEDGLLACLAKGADRAVRVWEEALAGADPLAVASVLAAVAAREQPDLILCGVQSSDAAAAATGVAVAGLLDLTRVAVVNAIERDGERLRVQRELDGGDVEVLSLSMPALLTVQTGINEPRYATLRAIKQARAKPLEVLALCDLALDAAGVHAAAGSRTVRFAAPERGRGAQMLDGSASAIAARIAELVAQELRA
jgi:electron transfer flavoprotein beta subunit